MCGGVCGGGGVGVGVFGQLFLIENDFIVCVETNTQAMDPAGFSGETVEYGWVSFFISVWTSHEKKIVTMSSQWAHGDHGGHGSGTQWSRLSHG